MNKQKDKRTKRPVFIYGEKINLSPVDEGDIRRLCQWINDPDIRRFITVYTPKTMTEEKEFVASASTKRNAVIFAVLDKKTEEHIGNAELGDIHWRNGTAVFGFMIGAKKYWGNGYGTDVLKTILQYAFQTLNLWKVKSSVMAANIASYRCHERCGFKKIGVYRKEYVVDGVRHDVFLLEINRDEWLKLLKLR